MHGTHGTSQRNAAIIKLHGFNLTEGRLGKGAYFWADSFLAQDLARGWFQQQKAERGYKEALPLESVIKAQIDCDEIEHIDLEDQVFKSQLQQLASHHNVTDFSARNIARMHSLVIEEFEKQNGVKIKVIEVRLAPPKPTFVPKYSINMFGAPICYVVRDANCITIKQML